MNTLERWKSGDKRLQINVEGLNKEYVKELFEFLGWNTGYYAKIEHYTGEIWTNTRIGCDEPDTHLLHGDRQDENYPLSTIQDLETIVEYEAQQKQSKEEEDMFTKDMLISGTHIVEMRDSTRCLVAGNYIIGENSYMPLSRYNDELELLGDLRSLDIVKVFNGEHEKGGALYSAGAGLASYINQTGLPIVWQRESAEDKQKRLKLEKQQQLMQSLKEDLKRAEKALQEAQAKLDEES